MWVSLDFPDPQGSIRYLDRSTLARTPATGARSWSTDVSNRAQAPLGKLVLHVLQETQPEGQHKISRKPSWKWGHTLRDGLLWTMGQGPWMTAPHRAPSPAGAHAHTASAFTENPPDVRPKTTFPFHNRVGAAASKRVLLCWETSGLTMWQVLKESWNSSFNVSRELGIRHKSALTTAHLEPKCYFLAYASLAISNRNINLKRGKNLSPMSTVNSMCLSSWAQFQSSLNHFRDEPAIGVKVDIVSVFARVQHVYGDLYSISSHFYHLVTFSATQADLCPDDPSGRPHLRTT